MRSLKGDDLTKETENGPASEINHLRPDLRYTRLAGLFEGPAGIKCTGGSLVRRGEKGKVERER
jgi:hypothetical protein